MQSPVVYKPVSSDITFNNKSSKSGTNSSNLLQEIETVAPPVAMHTNLNANPLRNASSSDLTLGSDKNKVWEPNTCATECRLQPGKTKQMLNETVRLFESEIQNSNASASEKADKLAHLKVLERRCEAQLQKLTTSLNALYGHRDDFEDVLTSVLKTCITAGLERPAELRALDRKREDNPDWFCSNKSIEATLYVDRHCKTLDKLEEEIPLFKSLNINMLHLMPTIYKLPAGDNDGGYAISDFRTVNTEIGTMDQLRKLFSKMRQEDISPAVDVTINHTSHEHPWAEAAKAGDPEKQGYFFLIDKAEKDEYQPHLEDIFPNIRKGSFTWNEDTKKFVWTTFKSSQWDLNYTNPKVLTAMAGEFMFLANQGAEVLRFDAAPFVWKVKGTSCIHQKGVVDILSIFNSMVKITAPGVILKSESISEPKDTKLYVGEDLCQLGYNAMIPAHLWDALANKDATFMSAALAKHMQTSDGCAWVNYARCHDDIIYYFDTDLAKELGIDVEQRQTELVNFYLGNTKDSFSIGYKFQNDPKKITGTQASLAGIERALQSKDPQQTETAINRIKLINSLTMSLPGIPLINLTGSDDRGQINDYSYLQDDAKKDDSRWVHRPLRNNDFSQKNPLEIQVMDRVFTDLANLARIRSQEMSAFGAGPMQVIQTGKDPVLGFIRENDQQKVMVLANFSDKPQPLDSKLLEKYGMTSAVDKIGRKDSQPIKLDSGLELAPYQSMWLAKDKLKHLSAQNSHQHISAPS